MDQKRSTYPQHFAHHRPGQVDWLTGEIQKKRLAKDPLALVKQAMHFNRRRDPDAEA